MDTIPFLITALIALIVLDAAALAFGADSRDGFADDRDPAGLR